MNSVEMAIRELRQAALAALAEGTSLPPGVACVAERLTLSLAVRFHPSDDDRESGRCDVASDADSALHHLTLEFRLGPPAAVKAAGHPTDATETLAPVGKLPPDVSAVAILSEILGAPGFDSSARATVFRETLEELGEVQRRQVLASLGSPASDSEDPPVTQARHRIHRLSGTGPAGKDRGPKLLRELAARHPAESLIQLAKTHWRTPSQWATEAPTIS
jgi:hypothetical protein